MSWRERRRGSYLGSKIIGSLLLWPAAAVLWGIVAAVRRWGVPLWVRFWHWVNWLDA